MEGPEHSDVVPQEAGLSRLRGVLLDGLSSVGSGMPMIGKGWASNHEISERVIQRLRESPIKNLVQIQCELTSLISRKLARGEVEQEPIHLLNKDGTPIITRGL